MKKDVVYKLLSYHLGKPILDKVELNKNIKNIKSEYEKDKIKKLLYIINKYKNTDEYVEVDEFAIKVLKENFSISKNEVMDKLAVDNKIYKIVFEYLNEVNDKNHSFDVFKRSQKNPLTRFEVLDIDYTLLIKRQDMTLQKIGDELGYTRERIRQKINDTKEILKEYNHMLNVNYIYYEDIKYLPQLEQAIVYANNDKNLESVGMYIFDEKMSNFILEVTKKFRNMLINEDDGVVEYIDKNYEIIKRYIRNDKGFYMIKGDLYNLYDENGLNYNKFLLNFLEESQIEKFEINKKFLEMFRTSTHGMMFEEKTGKKVTQLVLKDVVKKEMIIKSIHDEYIYNPYVMKTLLANKSIIEDILEKNLPIRGKYELGEIFEEEIEELEISSDKMYYFLKDIYDDKYKFNKYNIDKRI